MPNGDVTLGCLIEMTDTPSHTRAPLSLKPSPASVFLRASGPLVVCAVLIAICLWCHGALAGVGEGIGEWMGVSVAKVVARANVGIIILLIVRAVWVIVREMLLWSSRVYTLNAKQISSHSGILRRVTVGVPVRNIQTIVVDRTAGERLLGLGTICITSAGSQGVDVAWVSIARPHERAATIRSFMDASRPMPVWLTDDPNTRARPLVLGLVGGVGAGKSTVAGILGEMGFLMIDADRDARSALDRPEVRKQLVKWWGEKVLLPDGKVDRKAVASIIFGDPTQRTRLEELVHPIVKATRGSMIERAAAEGAVGVAVDAPLLFEAASDKECDAVLFVDAPLEQRLTRVKSRGWDEKELVRRENAQMPLDEKRRRSAAVVVNDANIDTLRERVREAVDAIKNREGGGKEGSLDV